MYLSIDPGKTTGWARFDEQGEPIAFGKITGPDKFLDWLEDQSDVSVYIIEEYRNRPGTKVNVWSTGPTQQHIGAIKRIAHKRNITIHMQEASQLSIGLRFIGMHRQYKGKHVPDDVSALAHGTYFLRKAGIQK